MQQSASQASRILEIYESLRSGHTMDKPVLAQRFGVDERTIQRDIDSIRDFLSERTVDGADAGTVIYDRRRKGFILEGCYPSLLSNSEILAVCKILLESRSMVKSEMLPLLDKLVTRCVPEEQKKAVDKLIANEKHHYIEPHHGRPILDGLWEIGQAIQNHQVMEIEYERIKEPKLVKRTVEPVGIMFSEYYFYLTAFLRDVDRSTEFDNADDLFPTIYRIDCIKSFRVLKERFQVPYTSRFEEGEFRKRAQFMYGGKLVRIRFKYTGPSIEAVLDRLPTAEIVSQDAEGWIVQAEVFGKGIEMWLRSQGEYIKNQETCYESGD